jgi:hypothetical protein
MPNVTRGEVVRGIREIVDRMLEDVGQDGRRWCDLIEAFPHVPTEKQEQLLARSEAVNKNETLPVTV